MSCQWSEFKSNQDWNCIYQDRKKLWMKCQFSSKYLACLKSIKTEMSNKWKKFFRNTSCVQKVSRLKPILKMFLIFIMSIFQQIKAYEDALREQRLSGWVSFFFLFFSLLFFFVIKQSIPENLSSFLWGQFIYKNYNTTKSCYNFFPE